MNPRRLNFAFCNMFGLNDRKELEVSRFFRSKKVDIMFLVETWLTEGRGVNHLDRAVYTNQIAPPDAIGIEKTKRGRPKEGILVLCKDEIRPLMSIIAIGASKRWLLLNVAEYYICCCYFSAGKEKDDEILDMVQFIVNHENIDIDSVLFVGDLTISEIIS